MNGERKQTSPWVWIGLGCGTVIIAGVSFVAIVVFIVFTAMRSSEPYRDALARAQRDPRVIAALGSRIEPSYFFSGSIKTENRDGSANIDIPLHGPKGKGTLHVVATKSNGHWTYDTMSVETGDQTLDLRDRISP